MIERPLINWQTTRSAPLDGTHILMFAPLARNSIFVARYVPATETFHVSLPEMQIGEDGHFTHWSPLPLSPATVAEPAADQVRLTFLCCVNCRAAIVPGDLRPICGMCREMGAR